MTSIIAVTGSSGLVGTELKPRLIANGHQVLQVSRPGSRSADVVWDPNRGEFSSAERDKLNGVAAVVHLAGDNIAAGRWTVAKKARIRDSRVNGTQLLCSHLAQLSNPPKTLICASAIGYYGDRGTEVCFEESLPGAGFLPEVCCQWESACDPARSAGIRVVNLRIGVVLSPRGGALAKMLLPFRLCLGGIVGNGQQYWSWISLDDLVSSIVFCLQRDDVVGPVNGVSPQPATNLEFTKALGRVLRRPTIFPMPGFAARLVLGEMADSLLLASCKVLPRRLEQAGFSFQFANLEDALRHLLK